jgi:hypothetical protein
MFIELIVYRTISYFPYSKFSRFSAVKITPEMFRNNNFVNKDGQNISFGRIHQNVGLGEYNIHNKYFRVE